jgi:hypothetical protein
VVEAVFVVGSCDDLGDDKLAVTRGDYCAVTEVGVLVEEAVVFLVNADSVLNYSGLTLGVDITPSI